MSRFRSSGGKHACDDLFIISGECTGDRSHVEPPYSADQGHDIYGPSFSWEGGQRLYPKGATGGRHFLDSKTSVINVLRHRQLLGRRKSQEKINLCK